jgi:DNA-binding winged helix-turn-helix (wHTH) protein
MTLPQFSIRRCTIDGSQVKLSRREVELLSILLVNHPEKFIRMGDLIEMIWPDALYEPEYAESSVSVSVFKLRKKGVCILAAKSRGYRIPRIGRAA